VFYPVKIKGIGVKLEETGSRFKNPSRHNELKWVLAGRLG
jgi:hypothetical protein